MPGTEENPAYASMELTLEKTFVMVFTGEIDYGDLVFTHEFGKFIFALFIFFVMYLESVLEMAFVNYIWVDRKVIINPGPM